MYDKIKYYFIESITFFRHIGIISDNRINAELIKPCNAVLIVDCPCVNFDSVFLSFHRRFPPSMSNASDEYIRCRDFSVLAEFENPAFEKTALDIWVNCFKTHDAVMVEA